MSVDELIRLRKEKEDKVKYVPLVRKIDNTEKKLYNYGSVYNKKSVYDNDRTRIAVEQIERSFRKYINAVAGIKFDNMIAWMDIGVICKVGTAKEYVEAVQRITKPDADGLTYKIDADESGIENVVLQNNVLDDMVAVRICDVTVDHRGDYDTCEYELDNLVDDDISYGTDIFLVKFDEFIALLNALGYRVVSRHKKIESFQDYLDAFMDYTNEDGFRIIADFDPERKKQKELGDSAFKYTIKQPGGMIN